MKRFFYELSESWKIAAAQMRSNMTRSTLTALGVIIGIVAVTLMGTAISGIQVGFDKSMAIFGDDVLYVGQWPWKQVNDWWNYRDRKKIKTEYAEALNRMIAMTPNSNLTIAIPTSSVSRSVKYMDSEVNNVVICGTVSDYIITSTFDFKEGRFFNELESRGGANVCVIGYDVADALFPSASPIDKSIGIINITFVSVTERTKESGTRKALGARRSTILLQFLIESTALCLLGGFIGLSFAYFMCLGIGKAFPGFPIHFSFGLVLASVIVSVMTGLFSGFAPAWTASRLDPVTALRYE